ncbi:hypothetical protein POF51_26240 [Brevibacillus sp. AG]|uniref:hypothetical protein n=1 Tax=Brevibacillus sp. AG TaxID=3020891 RepID=UPI00232D79DC|nr:hypothetical protein [Brevibacillus sp. AG]MDC0764223.1 hypothetical protein [Brevibacillus sp. AG]
MFDKSQLNDQIDHIREGSSIEEIRSAVTAALSVLERQEFNLQEKATSHDLFNACNSVFNNNYALGLTHFSDYLARCNDSERMSLEEIQICSALLKVIKANV